MQGTLYQINVGSGGIPKHPIASATVTLERVLGDDQTHHMSKPRVKPTDFRGHGGADKAVCLFSFEVLEELVHEGVAVFPGALGENFTTQGLDYRLIRVGDLYQIGDKVMIQITEPREPCATIRDRYTPAPQRSIGAMIYNKAVKEGKFLDHMWGRSGFYARVRRTGSVQTGDAIHQLEFPDPLGLLVPPRDFLPESQKH
ncbi:MAG TPA: MOSC domain-containing protein [Candidatus Nanoarchaeia archaeon]|nr:MOSC domain-containing protein [Candidatus Nanoarchaeia archaeon]